MLTHEELKERVARLKRAGFDAVVAFDAQQFNRTVQSGSFRLPDFERETVLSLVIGNSRALWEPFVRALDADPALRASPHPLDAYAEAQVSALQTEVGVRSEVFFAHQARPRVPIQRIAAAAGLAELSPSHMSVHPVHGPWLGLRAVVVLDHAFDGAEGLCAELIRAPAARHCPQCAAPCMQALHSALALTPHPQLGEDTWRAWLGVRDACPVAPQQRYGPRQIRYHYTKDRGALLPEDP